MTKEALKLALEALEIQAYNSGDEKYTQAITALKEALAQPAPVQEPVGYVAENGVVDWNVCAPPILTDLYTTPSAQRTWVGLTDAERNKLWRDVVKWGDPSHDDVELMKALEAVMKEKNDR